MSKTRSFIFAVLFVSLLLGAFSSVAVAQSGPEGPVKIAVLGPFTGDAASIGQEQLAWAQLAVADFNEATGWNVEVVEGDTQLDPALAVTVAESIIADPDIYGAVGPAGSQEVSATGQMFFDARLVHISGSATNPDLTTMGYDTFFRTVPTDAVQGPTDANFIFNELGATQLYIIDDQSSYSVGLADQVEQTFGDLGGTIVGRESVTQQDTDFSSLVTVIGSSGAEVVFFPGQIASQGALLARQLQEQGVEATVFGGDGFLNATDFIAGAGGATEGAYVSNFAPDVNGIESSADIVARYIEANDDNFTAFGPPSYAAALVVLEAMQRAFEAGDLSREAVRDEVANTNQEMSVLGIPLAFDENGDVLGASFYIYQVQGDNFVVVPTTAEAGGGSSDVGTIKIAIMGPFTGAAATIGTEQLNFARVAVADFEAATGIDVELVEEDTQLDAAIALTVAERVLADPDILAVIGPSGSQEVESTSDLFEEAGVARVSPSATRPSLTQMGWATFFRTVPNDDVQGPTAADFILNTLGATNVFILDDQSSYSVTLSDIVQDMLSDGGATVARDSVTQDDTDFSSLATRIGGTGATVVYFPGQIASQGALLASQLQEQGIEATLVGGDGFVSPDLINEASEGSFVMAFAPDIHGIPEAEAVTAEYTDEYGEFGSFGPPTYLATMVILEAAQRAAEAGNLTREGVLEEIGNTDMQSTIFGSPLAFDENGDVQGAQYFVLQIQDGAFVSYVP